MGKKNDPSLAILSLQRRTYKGNEYYEFVGSCKGQNKSVLVSIVCDSDGQIKRYTGTNKRTGETSELIYTRVRIFSNVAVKNNRQNF